MGLRRLVLGCLVLAGCWPHCPSFTVFAPRLIAVGSEVRFAAERCGGIDTKQTDTCRLWPADLVEPADTTLFVTDTAQLTDGFNARAVKAGATDVQLHFGEGSSASASVETRDIDALTVEELTFDPLQCSGSPGRVAAGATLDVGYALWSRGEQLWGYLAPPSVLATEGGMVVSAPGTPSTAPAWAGPPRARLTFRPTAGDATVRSLLDSSIVFSAVAYEPGEVTGVELAGDAGAWPPRGYLRLLANVRVGGSSSCIDFTARRYTTPTPEVCRFVEEASGPQGPERLASELTSSRSPVFVRSLDAGTCVLAVGLEGTAFAASARYQVLLADGGVPP